MEEPYVFPFFWQHGEDEGTLRAYMKVIQDANCHAVCVESRPHPDFCGPKWWQDMDVILDEAQKREMQVWILDDSHFPSGYANGAALHAPLELRRQSVYCHIYDKVVGRKHFSCDVRRMYRQLPATPAGRLMNLYNHNGRYRFDDDRVLGVSALVEGSQTLQPVAYMIEGRRLHAELPQGTQKLYVSFLTRNAGIHRSYINMMEDEACRLFLDTVYEPHYARYGDLFGSTIAGFFSDEPELGNGCFFTNQVAVGKDFDMPWSSSVERALREAYGDSLSCVLPLLWDSTPDPVKAASVRLQYMDLVTRRVEHAFSLQIGTWCRDHGVQYIGHVIEDNNQHTRTGGSLGHYFRGLSGQDMAGIDDIGGQVLPQGEDLEVGGILRFLGGRDGTFYHFMLGKLGASCAAIDPRKNGRCMCEIFGNYGWGEGARLEKYLADHFMVQGVNRFVPHAFSPKQYPDPDCPPHFYAGGHDPQYRAFGSVIAYMNRICPLISDGRPVVSAAILYNAEAEWAGDCMLDQTVARVLMEHQIEAHVLPLDAFTEAERYETRMDAGGLTVHYNRYTDLLIPYLQYLPEALERWIDALRGSGCRVWFVGGYPAAALSGSRIEDAVQGCGRIEVESLPEILERDVLIFPASKQIRVYHYIGKAEIWYFVNEQSTEYVGEALLHGEVTGHFLDPWDGKTYRASVLKKGTEAEQRSAVRLVLRPGESAIFVRAVNGAETLPLRVSEQMKRKQFLPKQALNGPWERSICRAIQYPCFEKHTRINQFADYGKTDPSFSGFLAYEKTQEVEEGRGHVMLEILDAGEAVELFVNGTSAGIQVLPPFYFDVTDLLRAGENTFRIEVATTLERERGANKKKQAPIGILGEVSLYRIGPDITGG